MNPQRRTKCRLGGPEAPPVPSPRVVTPLRPIAQPTSGPLDRIRWSHRCAHSGLDDVSRRSPWSTTLVLTTARRRYRVMRGRHASLRRLRGTRAGGSSVSSVLVAQFWCATALAASWARLDLGDATGVNHVRFDHVVGAPTDVDVHRPIGGAVLPMATLDDDPSACSWIHLSGTRMMDTCAGRQPSTRAAIGFADRWPTVDPLTRPPETP
jgi:hypothetical protein